ASARSICGVLVLKKLQKEIQSILPGFSAKLTSTVGERSCSPDTSGATSFQMIFEVDEKPRTLITDCLVIKHFLRKIIIIHHQIRFNFSVKVNGIFSTEIFGAENEPILNLWNGIALVVNYQHYVRPKFITTESHCSRIHPVLGHPETLSIPDDVAGMGLLGELILTPVAALCPSPRVFSTQLNRISSVSIFLYGPSGLPLLLSNQEQPSTTVLKDICYFIDWKKYHLCVVPNLDLSLDGDLVLPDVSYRVESSEGDQYQNMDPQRQTLLLFLFVDFHSGFLVKQMEIWGTHTLLTAHLSAILMESRSAVRDAIQTTVDHVLEQHHQAAKATDTQELGTKLHKIFHDVTQHRFLHHCSCDVKQQATPEKKDSAQTTEDAHESNSLELLAEVSGQAENKRLKRESLHQSVEEREAPHSASVRGTPQVSQRHVEPTAASLTMSRAEHRAVHVRAPARARASPGSLLEDALWLQEVSNLSEWLSPSHKSR
uniref:TOP6B like initiator of meiotic double strand breaks n=1 Tax=Sciurus vulgaris TaxID=55149 RepID=A0A8D2AWZ2_SCIVU